jgi:integrase
MATIKKRMWTDPKGAKREAWQVRFVDQDGKQRAKQFERKKDADAYLTSVRPQVRDGTYTPESTSISVAEAATLWLARGEQEELEHSTLRQYRSHATYHVEPLLGAEKLSRLTAPRIERFRDDLLASDRSRALAKKVLSSLKAILSEAQRRGLVAQNVAANVTIRTGGRHTQAANIPSPAEIRDLLAKAQGGWRPLMVVAVFTGMRASELRGLTWDHVDFEVNVIRVRQRADDQGTIGTLKTKTSRRDIPMTPMVANTLKEWRLACPRQGVKKDDDGNVIAPGTLHFVFPNGAGNVESHANILHRGFGPLQVACEIVSGPKLDQAGAPVLDKKGNPVMLPKYGLHALRHFFASWLIDQGFGPKRVQSLMGHASIQMTFDVYGHLFPQEDDRERFAAGELALVGVGKVAP